MFSLIKKSLFIFSFSFFFSQNVFLGVKVNDTSSKLKIKSGSNFVVDTEINDYKGTIVKEEGAGITGNDINFNEGKVKDNETKFNITGAYSPGNSDKIRLTGGELFRGKGGFVSQLMEVSGVDNYLQGDFYTSEDICLLNSDASLLSSVLNSLSSNIQLNGGTLQLDDSLKFDNGKKVIGPGKVLLNNKKISFGARPLVFIYNLYFDSASDVELNSNVHLEDEWTFSGDGIIDGRNNICCFDDSLGCAGRIVVERGASLLIKNIILKKVNNSSLFCMDNSGTITFQNVKLILDQDYTFSLGRFFVIDSLKISGKKIFSYQSNQESLIHSYSEMFLDLGVTFSYDPIGGERKDLLRFEDETSFLYLNNASLHTTTTGIELTKGAMIVDGVCNLSSEIYNNNGDGITFGSDSIDLDFNCEILSGSILNISSGYFSYRNIDDLSFNFLNTDSFLDINVGSFLKLYQNLNCENGQVRFSSAASMFKAPGQTIIGPVSIYKE